MDTVLKPANRPKRKERSEGRLWGTGAADAKGGLAVMLAALNCIEDSPYAKSLGWEVLIVPDEEIGSPMSKPLLVEAAKYCQIGLVFEPALPDGALVGERPGSGNFVVIVHGRAAHAGREPEAGRNAIDALADLIVSLRSLKTEGGEIRLNVGQIEGGGPVNVVPDFALCRFNLRVRTLGAMKSAEKTITRLTAQAEKIEGISVEVKGGFGRPPKTPDPKTLYLLKHLMAVGRDLDLSLRCRSSGGVCDGNTLSWAGLPNVDSMGPVGDGIHTTQEFVIETSIPERARLIALFLMKLAKGEIPWPPTETDLHP
jgi:glutamate carboxypeptidase